MNYKELLEKLKKMDKEQLSSDVTIHDTLSDEYYSADGLFITKADDVLDKNHPVIDVRR